MYATGYGCVRLSRECIRRTGQHRDQRAAVPGSAVKIIEQIANQMRAKKLPMLEDLRDESDHENAVRLVLTAQRPHRLEAKMMQHLSQQLTLRKAIAST